MKGKKLYVGNLNYSVTNRDLEELFSDYGEVTSVNVIEGKGFGFVEMGTTAQAEKARKELNETTFRGRTLRIDEANPPAQPARKSGPSRKAEPVAESGEEEEWSGLSPTQVRERLRELVLGASLKETGFGARRFYFVARDNTIPFLDISDELASRLEKGLAAIVEVPGDGIDEYTVVPRSMAQKMLSVEPELVRFLNPEATGEPERRRSPRRGDR